MKKNFVLLILIFISIESIAQNLEVNTSSWAMFFAGTGNSVTVNTNGFDPTLIDLQLSDGTIQKQFTVNSLKFMMDSAKSKNHLLLNYALNFQAGSINKRITMSIHYKFGAKDSVLFEKKYYVIQLPDPTAFISDSLTEATMTREEMLTMYNLGVYMPDFKNYTAWYIMSYDCQFMPPDGNFKSYHVDKNIFPTELHQQIEACKPGDTFIFRNIRVDGLDAYSRYVNSVVVNIK